MKFKCDYLYGPLDGSVEVRQFPPLDGETVYRLWDGHYVPYQWSAEKRAFVYVCKRVRA